MQTRNTKQKEAIRGAFTDADRPLSPEEALALAKTHVDGVSLATIYRNIASLLEDGWLTAVEMPGAATRYEVAGKEHHHHFRCTVCGKVFELEGCAVQISRNVPKGFRVTGHEFFLFGSCQGCA
jgi:Fur family transcriptional regulator, ferric uptake regulator